MSYRNIEVIVSVRDNASKKLEKVNNAIKNTGKMSRQSYNDMTRFNRTLFSMTAFIATFYGLYRKLTNELEQGAALQRVDEQFTRLFGPRSRLFDMMRHLTTTTVDQFAAMKEAIALKSMGIVHTTSQVANIFAKASVAAKMAGIQSAEGIKQYSDFLKDGNVSHLQFLNLLAKSNPALMTQMAVLQKAGGIMGGVISMQQRLAIGNRLLTAVTINNMKSAKDFTDILLQMHNVFFFLRGDIGILLFKAFKPLAITIADLAQKFDNFITNISKNKNIIFLVRTILVATSATLGLVAAFGTLRLATIALTSVGIGIPGLLELISTLGVVLFSVTKKSDTFTQKLKTLGAFFKGIWQLVTSFSAQTGKSKISKSVLDALGGPTSALFGFVKFISKVIIVVRTAVTDVVHLLTYLGNKVDSIFHKITSLFVSFTGKNQKVWSHFWVDSGISPLKKFIRDAGVLLGGFLAAWAGKKLFSTIFGMAGGLLSRLPIIGKFFGGGRKPTGTANDPIYVEPVGRFGGGLTGGTTGFLSKFFGAAFKSLARKLGLGNFVKILERLGLSNALWALAKRIPFMGTIIEVFSKATSILGDIVGSIPALLMRAAPMMGTGIALAASAAIGYYLGRILNNLMDSFFARHGISGGLGGLAYNLLHGHIFDQHQRGTAGIAGITKLPGQKTNVSIHTPSESQDEMVNKIGESIAGIHNVRQRKQAELQAEATLSALGAAGKPLTEESMQSIMQRISNPQLDVLSKIEHNQRQGQSLNPITSRR